MSPPSHLIEMLAECMPANFAPLLENCNSAYFLFPKMCPGVWIVSVPDSITQLQPFLCLLDNGERTQGEGLSNPLRDFDVSLSPNRKAPHVGSLVDPDDIDRWRLHNLPVGADYVCALATEHTVRGRNIWSGR